MFGHNSPAAGARELCEASKDAKSLVVRLKKEESFRFPVFVGNIIIGVGLSFF